MLYKLTKIDLRMVPFTRHKKTFSLRDTRRNTRYYFDLLIRCCAALSSSLSRPPYIKINCQQHLQRITVVAILLLSRIWRNVSPQAAVELLGAGEGVPTDFKWRGWSREGALLKALGMFRVFLFPCSSPSFEILLGWMVPFSLSPEVQEWI